jgi:hypothetical protein
VGLVTGKETLGAVTPKPKKERTKMQKLFPFLSKQEQN